MAGRTQVLLRLAVCAAALSLFTGTGMAADDPVEQVASGLDNPRHLSFGQDGALYVAEAGKGGAGPCVETGEGPACYGPTGAITRIRHGSQTRVVTGLPSIAGADGSATGPHDVAMNSSGALLALIGLGGSPSLTAPGGVAAGLGMGTLMRIGPGNGSRRVVADLAAYEASANPDGVDPPDSNPYGLSLRGDTAYATDAGGNSLVSIRGFLGTVRTVAVFPTALALAPPFLGLPPGTMIPSEAVPTAVESGPDGALYVGQLTGFPFPVGGAAVFKIGADGSPSVYASGFTNIVDIAFGRDGSLYVVEISSAGILSDTLDGALIRVRPNGTRTSVPLFAPGGVAIGSNGSAYVTICSVCSGGGAVVKVSL